MARADKYTKLNNMPEFYSDFTINMDRNPVTNILQKVVNEQAVKNSIRQLILTNIGERPCQPYLGSKIQSLLFDIVDQVTTDLLITTITETIQNHEPRCTLEKVDVIPNEDQEEYRVTIEFSLINTPGKTYALTEILRRIR